MTEPVQLQLEGSVAWLRLNRPEALNALDKATVASLDEHLALLERDASVRVVVLTGTGRAFCAGADLKAVSDGVAADPSLLGGFVFRIAAVIERLAALPKPVIAAVNGLACAGGLELVMACDLVVASDRAEIGDAHANYGLLPGAGGCARLPRLVAPAVAKYLLFTGALVPAADLFAAGLVNEVVPHDELDQRIAVLANQIAQKSPLGLSRMKRLVDDGLQQPLDEALRLERLAVDFHAHSYDLKEGLAAFIEKRSPAFRGN